ncbi:MAG TPA: hypothetical protein PLG05_06685 [Bacteroidales bacterium]|jgi:hypothetical protein|nr:hypothetical protein [Bacteroidales bacterium]HOR60434.1 hypothetical protein [Bacteroidales bacterium]HPL04845.1 hypothetical protein [Bacteroidales bacterium]HRS19726.1 hypothetical protein [Bacteroidales bacterium]
MKIKKFENIIAFSSVRKNVFCESSVSYGLPKRASLNPVTRWHYKNLLCKKQVNVSNKRFHRLKMPVRQTHFVTKFKIIKFKFLRIDLNFSRVKRLLLQLFRVATVTIMEISTILETTVIGGVLPRTILIMHGTGT